MFSCLLLANNCLRKEILLPKEKEFSYAVVAKSIFRKETKTLQDSNLLKKFTV